MVRTILTGILKIALIPLALACTLAAWTCIFLTWVSSWIFNALAMILFLTALGSAGFGLESKEEVIRMLVTAFVIFILPHIVDGLAAGLLILKYRLMSWIFG